MPFVGRSGQVARPHVRGDRARPNRRSRSPTSCPGGHQATAANAGETQICLPFIQRQIELCNPEVLVTVGQPSTGALLGVQGIIEEPRPLVSLRHRHARNPRHADAASGLSAALADRQAAGLARHAGDQEGAG